jgi:hypothetical protein
MKDYTLNRKHSPIKYYDLKKHWTKKIMPFLGDSELNSVLVRDLNKYTIGWCAQPFGPDQYPADIENGDWGFGDHGPRPRYWRYVKFGTCHWIANFALRLATLVDPLQQWQIVSSERHTTVWDGFDTLFEFNHQAMGMDAPTSFYLASTDGEYFLPHCDYEPGFAPHYTFELWLNDEPITDEAAANFRKRMTYIRDHYPNHPEIMEIFTDGALRVDFRLV